MYTTHANITLHLTRNVTKLEQNLIDTGKIQFLRAFSVVYFIILITISNCLKMVHTQEEESQVQNLFCHALAPSFKGVAQKNRADLHQYHAPFTHQRDTKASFISKQNVNTFVKLSRYDPFFSC